MGDNSTPAAESLAWYEKDDDDLQFELYNYSAEEEEDEEQPSRRKTKRQSTSDIEPGVDYHIDIWFMIGDHVKPENVGRFASICHKAHYVTHTVRFWTSMYKRYYDSDKNLPAKFEIYHLHKLNGLRTRVISSLFQLYPPFVARTKDLVPFNKEPSLLEGASCLASWYQKIAKGWSFFFKFKIPSGKACPMSRGPSTVKKQSLQKRQLLGTNHNIHKNSEEGCCVLQVVCGSFVPLPIVMGLVLHKGALTISSDMRNHKLRLVFGPGHLSKSNVLASGVNVVMDPVTRLHILHWWHPKYPY